MLMTNRVLANWKMFTFDAFLIDRQWMENPPDPRMKVTTFLRTFLLEMAKANYYYYNNTKGA